MVVPVRTEEEANRNSEHQPQGDVGQSPPVHYFRMRRHSEMMSPANQTASFHREGMHSFQGQRRHSLSELPALRQRLFDLSDLEDAYGHGQISEHHNHFGASFRCPDGISHETVVLGDQLFLQFLREEIQERNIPEPDCLNPQGGFPPSASIRLAIVRMGRTLRQVANEFAKSQQRRNVWERAQAVRLDVLNFSAFQSLLYGLFQEGGITYERVVVLFYFCADLAIRALMEGLQNIFHKLTFWSQRYIVEKLSVWVQKQGGWGSVLDHSMDHIYKAAIISFCCVGIIALLIYIRRSH